ncbi:MAG: hypothetical protein ISR69_04450 [Gammaproteobacteria bacterium]|nr:hypothetical protein [Gammaproteobacteria bacterium]
MANKEFNLKLNASYKDDKNTIDALSILVKTDNGWEDLNLDIRSPGFLLFINGLFSCQHLYMRINSAECGVILESSEGELNITTNDNWEIQSAKINFTAKIKSGTLSESNLTYIIERMKHCPVSSNLPKHINLQNRVSFI